ncbi:TPR-like protein [Serendipita vermifera]|nr:TPR-like protein [Serendipita vermifera]
MPGRNTLANRSADAQEREGTRQNLNIRGIGRRIGTTRPTATTTAPATSTAPANPRNVPPPEPQSPNASFAARRSKRVNQLRVQQSALSFESPTPQVGDPSAAPMLNLRGRKNDPAKLFAITPNSSTLLASPAGSSPRYGNRNRSRSNRRKSLLGPGQKGGFLNAFTPSRPGGFEDSSLLHHDGTSTAESSMALSPMKLNIHAGGNEDRSVDANSRSIDSIDLKVEDEDEVSEEEEDDDEDYTDEEEDEEWGLVDRMRLWRHDAMTQHLYDTAIFWGDKVMEWTNDPSDAFWLAQVHFQTGDYARAERLLTRPFTIKNAQDLPVSDSPIDPGPGSTSFGFALGMAATNPQQAYTTPHHPHTTAATTGTSGFINAFNKGKQRDTGYEVDPFLASVPGGPSKFKTPAPIGFSGAFNKAPFTGKHTDIKPTYQSQLPLDTLVDVAGLHISNPGKEKEAAEDDKEAHRDDVALLGEAQISARLIDLSVMCRYLAAQCQVRLGKWAEALEVLGEENPFRDGATNGPHVANRDGGIKLEASMCHLRGTLYMRLNRIDRAKACFLEALALDVKCFESFNTLVQCQMLTTNEEWELIQGLRYKDQAPDDAEFIKMMYTIRLNKLKHVEEISLARRHLIEDYGLGNNCDLLYTVADSLYTQLKFADCFFVTSRILDITNIHLPTIPLHVACMYHLKHLHSRLFLLAHELVDKEPESAMSWYTVGIWYLVSSKWREARQYLSKTTLMDPRHAAGWVAFAHTFAKEGEHEHAITAYSTCARLFKGSHLPHLFIGMEHLKLSHLSMASDAFETAFAMCDTDPLVSNERGVVAFQEGDYKAAAQHFERALQLATAVQGSQSSWISTYCNLGTAQRKLNNLTAAEAAYKKVLAIEPRHATALASLAMVYHMRGEYRDAIEQYHEALSVEPLNSNVLELLNMALASGASLPLSIPTISEKVSLATQGVTERETAYMKKSAESDDQEVVGWDVPYGEPSAWVV